MQVHVQVQDVDGSWIEIPSGYGIIPDALVRFHATGLVPLDYNTVQFTVRDGDGFDVMDTFATSDAEGTAISIPRRFPVPGSYTLSTRARYLSNAGIFAPLDPVQFTVLDLMGDTQQPKTDNKWLMIGAAALAVVGAGWAIASRNKR